MSQYEILVVYFVSGIVGIVSHYIKMWLTGDIIGSLWSYLFIQYPRKTALTIFTFLGTLGAYFTSNSFDGITLQALVGLGFGMGYAADSSSNQGQKPEILDMPKSKLPKSK